MSELTLEQLIEAVNAAPDKNALEALVKQHLGLDIDKRRALKDLRAEVLAGLQPEDGAVSDADKPETTGESDESLSPPPLGDDLEKKLARKARLLKNTKTGRTFVWTPVLAKQSGFKEV